MRPWGRLARALVLALTFVLGTWILGWWAVPLLGAAWGLLNRGQPRFATAFLGAALAWLLLLAFDAARGPLASVATVLGGIFMVPGAVLAAVAILFAALLAGCAAQVAGTTRGPRPAP